MTRDEILKLERYLKTMFRLPDIQVEKGLEQLSEEGTIQIFQQLQMGMRDPIVGVVGALQFEVLQYRIEVAVPGGTSSGYATWNQPKGCGNGK